MHYIYGPIPSRRLGQSLGVDPIPLKTCNWNCVYCQLGRTSPLINERGEWAPRDLIVAEVRAAVEAHAAGGIDHISFVGSGEPTLHSGLGWMIRAVKAFTSIPVAVITNGAQMGNPEVRADLLAADLVLPTLCAGDEGLFRRIHRPHPDLSFASMLSGLEAFRAAFTGRLWLEVMLLAGLNDDAAALERLAAAIARVKPDQVHLLLPERPPAEASVHAPGAESLMRATALLGEVATVVPPSGATFDLTGHTTLEEALLAILQRHPMSDAQLSEVLNAAAPEQAASLPRRLVESGRAHLVFRHGMRFWVTDEQLFESVGVNTPATSPTFHTPGA